MTIKYTPKPIYWTLWL